jgi:hypothetical protein
MVHRHRRVAQVAADDSIEFFSEASRGRHRAL